MRAVLALLLLGIPALAQFGNGNAANPGATGGGGSGDITGVTAGDGISGGGSTGALTITNAAPLYGCTDTGGDDTYACSPTGFPSSYASGITLRIRFTTANTGAATIDAGPGAKAVKLPDGTTNPSNGDIVALKPMLVTYDTTGDGGSGAWILSVAGAAGGNAATTEAVTYGATPTFTMASNTLDTKTMTLTGNVSNCTIASATAGQTITWVLTASGATRTFACAGITNLGTLSIADTVTCTITANATSASAAFVKGSISCPNGNQLTFTSGGTAVVTFPTGTYSALGTAITNTFGAAGTLDMSAATNDEAFRLPNVAGASNTTEGAVSFDTTGDNLHVGANGVDNLLASVLASAPLVDGNCVEASIVSSRVRLADAGAPCGSGGSTPACTGFWPLGAPSYAGGIPFGASDVFAPNAGVANYGTSLLFYNPVACTATNVGFYIQAAAGASKGLLVQFRPVALTTVTCTTSVLTSGGSPDINATGWIYPSIGSCTLPAGPILIVVSSDSTSIKFGAWQSTGNAQAGRSGIAAKYAGFAASVSSGSAGSLAIATDISAISWTAETTAAIPAIILQ